MRSRQSLPPSCGLQCKPDSRQVQLGKAAPCYQDRLCKLCSLNPILSLTVCVQHGVWRKPGFWQVQLGVLRDVYHVTLGPRQAGGAAGAVHSRHQPGHGQSNSIMNYAPQLLQRIARRWGPRCVCGPASSP